MDYSASAAPTAAAVAPSSSAFANATSSQLDDNSYDSHRQPPQNPASFSSSLSKRQKHLPASLKISSYLQFQQNIKTTPFPIAGSPIRRKPVPSSTPSSAPSSPPVSRLRESTSVYSIDVAAAPSIDAVAAASKENTRSQAPQPESFDGLIIRDLDQYPRGHSPIVRRDSNGVLTSFQPRVPSEPVVVALSPRKSNKDLAGASHHKTAATSTKMASYDSATTSSARPPPIHIDASLRSMSSSSLDSNKAPKTPGNKITSFFGWNNTTSSPPPGADSYSDHTENGVTHGHTRSLSPPHSKSIPVPIDINRANTLGKPYPGATLSANSAISHLATPAITEKMNMMDAELREISAELAASIRREMDLEDMVERLQLEGGDNRRTSDYFSDSGYSSVKYPSSELGSSVDDIEKWKRKLDQEKAQLKVDLSQKWQDERTRRMKYESHVQILEDQVAHFRREKVDSSNLAGKTKELETALDDTRRRLAEERQLKDNFEDLLTAMRVEIEQHRNDNDHLQSRLKEAESADANPQKLALETSRLQQEIQNLKNENATLINARKMQMDMQNTSARFNAIAEEGGNLPKPVMGLTRSNTLARSSQRMSTVGGGNSGGLARSGSLSRGTLSRSNSVTAKDRESKELILVDKMKDVEQQRDALHRALKSLLERQAFMTREHEKEIRILERELESAKDATSPRRIGYEKEVILLREEIGQIRGRADDALEQKWQIEKGLGGLKMDLDRAEQETSSLRMLLQEHDIPLPENLGSPKKDLHDVQVTSTSLANAYKQLQNDREHAVSRQDNGLRSLEEEQRLAAQLAASAERSEALAHQVRMQLDTNSSLRNRLTDAIGRGDKEQQKSASRINELQSRLKTLEDTLMSAQQQSEDAVIKHEDEIKKIQDSHNAQLRRVRGGARTPTFGPNSPLSPLFASRSPRLDVTSSGAGIPLNQALKVEYLEKKVKELEKALDEAGHEMQEVVGRMNMAQIEVAELQADRDEAMKMSRKLQADIQAERKIFEDLLSQ